MKRKIPPLWAHQKESLKLCSKSNIIYDVSDPGCVSADTEFLTPTGWKRIDSWKNEQVAQFYPNLQEIRFVNPIKYVKRSCSKMIAIAPIRGTSQRLSHEHRVLYYRPNKTWGEQSANSFMQELHSKGANHLHKKFCSTFTLKSTNSIPLSDYQLRIMVMCIADGHFPSPSTTRCTLRLKRKHKQERARRLLKKAKIKFKERTCGGQPDFQVFRFYAPKRDRVFTEYYWNASQKQLEIIANELPHWDSSVDKRSSNGIRFSSTIRASAEFAQYAFAATKQPTSLRVIYKDRYSTNEIYNVHAQKENKFFGPGRKTSVYEVDNPEGYKYCFEVPSSFLLLRHNGYIFATGNTAKTRVQLEAFKKRKSPSALVIAPKSLLETAWVQDVRKFVPELKTSIAWAECRAEAFEKDADIYLINSDGVKWLAKQTKRWWNKHFSPQSSLIIDESTVYKNHKSQRSKAAAKIADRFQYRSGLTGTPNANSVTEIWHQMMLLDQGQRLGNNYYNFRNTVCIPQQVGPSPEHIQWVDRPGAEEAVTGLLSDVSIRHKFEDCMDIPQLHIYEHSFKPSAKMLKAYREMEATAILKLREGDIKAVNAAVLRNKLLQVSSGATYRNEQGYALLDTSRYELILDLVQEVQHSIVFFSWVHQKEELCKEAERRKIKYAVIDGTVSARKRAGIVAKYQIGQYQTLFLHWRTGGHGLTLTKGTRTIWSSPIYEADYLKQGNHRIYRGGQTKKTEAILIKAEGTIEGLVYERLQDKTKRMVNLLQLLET